jgi:hypothetical protein
MKSTENHAVETGVLVYLKKHEVFVSGQDGYHTYRIPALVRAGNGDLLAMCEARRDSERDDGKIDLVLKRSSDGGRTWGALERIYGEAGNKTIGNPVPIVDRVGGIHLIFCRNNIEAVLYSRSDDHGRSWSTPRKISDAPALEAMFGFPVQRFGTGPCHGIQLRNGRLVVPIWMKQGASHHYQEGTFRAAVLWSDDGGGTWRAGGLSAAGANESAVAELADGTLIMNSRSMAQPAGYRIVARSLDGGETFATVTTDTTLICPNCQGSLLAREDGTLFFCNPAVRNPEVSYRGDLRRELTLRMSRDGGQTWPEVCEIEHGPAGYSDLCVIDAGLIGVLYEYGQSDYRERIGFACCNLVNAKEACDSAMDVVVIGGGPSGAMAAVAAARGGARTLLVEQYGCLGGALTVMGTHPMMTFHNKAGRLLIKGLAQEVVDRLVQRGWSTGHIPDAITYNSTVTPFDSEGLKIVLDEMVTEAGIEVLFHTMLAGVEREGDRITAVTLVNRAGLSRVQAKVFIDATGDADLAVMAGVPCVMGRGDGVIQPMTMNAKVANVDMAKVRAYAHEHPEDFWFKDGAVAGLEVLDEAPRVSLGGFRKAWGEAKVRGEVDIPRGDVLFFETATHGVVALNCTRIQGLDPTKPGDLSRAEMLGRKQVQQVYTFLRQHAPGFENAVLMDTPAQVGVREGRHPQGVYVLQADDLLEEKVFPDPIMQAGYPIDIHGSSGSDTKSRHLRPEGAYQIPLRCLLVRSPNNLILAGRAISATHEAAAAIRVSPLAMGIGQAAGTLAGLAIKGAGDCNAVPYPDVRRVLLEQESMLP